MGLGIRVGFIGVFYGSFRFFRFRRAFFVVEDELL